MYFGYDLYRRPIGDQIIHREYSREIKNGQCISALASIFPLFEFVKFSKRHVRSVMKHFFWDGNIEILRSGSTLFLQGIDPIQHYLGISISMHHNWVCF